MLFHNRMKYLRKNIGEENLSYLRTMLQKGSNSKYFMNTNLKLTFLSLSLLMLLLGFWIWRESRHEWGLPDASLHAGLWDGAAEIYRLSEKGGAVGTTQCSDEQHKVPPSWSYTTILHSLF